jgi:hypothetical protein
MKSGKTNQNGKEELRKAQNCKKNSKQSKSSKSTTPKINPPNILNAISPS